MPGSTDTHTDEERTIAEWLHQRYERHAHHEGWDTQESTKVAFSDLPPANKRTMLLIARDVLQRERAAKKELAEQVKARMGKEASGGGNWRRVLHQVLDELTGENNA